ncbi:hypothetical protein BC834DRAFT_845217 [Gloeopeniophorella convolvens]|nr:hypothetical protein BC834DRAFT_845217 [Gloeopeniophorella convolvens]
MTGSGQQGGTPFLNPFAGRPPAPLFPRNAAAPFRDRSATPAPSLGGSGTGGGTSGASIRAGVPKEVTDKLSRMGREVAESTRTMNAFVGRLEALESSYEKKAKDLGDSLGALREELCSTLESMGTQWHSALEARIGGLEAHVANALSNTGPGESGGADGGNSIPQAQGGRRGRHYALPKLHRKTLATQKKNFPHPVSNPEDGTPVYFVSVGDRELLRPQWGAGWAANRLAWGDTVAQNVQQHGERFCPRAPAPLLRGTDVEVIIGVVQTAWTSYSDAYLKRAEAVAARGDADEVSDTDPVIKRKNRKINKAALRARLRFDLPPGVLDLSSPEFTFLGVTGYQSTDESETDREDARGREGRVGGPVDEDSEGKSQITTQGAARGARRKVAMKKKIWVSHPPEYRTAESSPCGTPSHVVE